MTTNHPAHGPVSLDRLHQISEILNKASAQSDGGNLGYAMADAVKVINGVIAAFGAEPVGEVVLGEYDDCGSYPDARVVCIAADGQADWENFKDGTRLYAVNPAQVSIDERAAFNAWNNDENLPIAGVGAKNAAWLAWQARAAMLQSFGNSEQLKPLSHGVKLPLDYLQGHKDGLEWAAQLAEANHPQTGDWLYDDPIELARAIRKGPDMPTVQGGNSPVIPDDVRRMDWLVSKTVDVREPMVYGSHSLFWSQTITDEEDDYHATKLREQIDAAMAAEQAAAPQQEVKTALEHGMQRYAGAMQKLSEGDK